MSDKPKIPNVEYKTVGDLAVAMVTVVRDYSTASMSALIGKYETNNLYELFKAMINEFVTTCVLNISHKTSSEQQNEKVVTQPKTPEINKNADSVDIGKSKATELAEKIVKEIILEKLWIYPEVYSEEYSEPNICVLENGEKISDVGKTISPLPFREGCMMLQEAITEKIVQHENIVYARLIRKEQEAASLATQRLSRLAETKAKLKEAEGDVRILLNDADGDWKNYCKLQEKYSRQPKIEASKEEYRG